VSLPIIITTESTEKNSKNNQLKAFISVLAVYPGVGVLSVVKINISYPFRFFKKPWIRCLQTATRSGFWTFFEVLNDKKGYR